MADPASTPTRKSVSLPAELWKKIEDFRFGNRVPTESEAIRRLIEAGLVAAEAVTVDDLIADLRNRQHSDLAEMIFMARLEITDPKEAERLHTVRHLGPPKF